MQTDVSADADESKPDQKDDDLDKANDGTAVPAEEIGLGTDSKDEQPDERDDDAHPQSRGDGVIGARAGLNRGGSWKRLIGGHLLSEIFLREISFEAGEPVTAQDVLDIFFGIAARL